MATSYGSANPYGDPDNPTSGANRWGAAYAQNAKPKPKPVVSTSKAPGRPGVQGQGLTSSQAKTLGAKRVAAQNAFNAKQGQGGMGGLSLEDILAMFGGGGGGGGGGGRGAAIQGLLNDVEARRQAAQGRYDRNKADITNMYGQLTDAIKGYKPTLEADFAGLQAGNTQRGAAQQGAISSELGAQNSRRQASLADLGITGEQAAGAPELESNAVLNEAIGDIGNTVSNWGGFLSSQGANAVERNQNQADATGATGALANRGLADAFEDYSRALDSEAAQIKASGVGGGGGGGGGGSNPLAKYAGERLIDQFFGIGDFAPQQQGMSALDQKLAYLGGLGSPDQIGSALQNILAYKQGSTQNVPSGRDLYVQQLLGLVD